MMRAVIAIVAVLVVVAGIVMLQYRGETPVNPTPGSNESQPQPQPQVQIVKAETHVIECANPDYWEPTFKDKDGNVITVLEKGKSSEGVEMTFLHSPKWLNKCKLEDTEEKSSKVKETAGGVPGLAVYNFEVKNDDPEVKFYVFLYAKWTDTCGNSCWILTNGPEKGGHLAQSSDFMRIEDQFGATSNPKEYNSAWHPLVEAGQPRKISLKKGMNRIEIHTREDGPTFYQLVVKTDASTPVGGPMKNKS